MFRVYKEKRCTLHRVHSLLAPPSLKKNITTSFLSSPPFTILINNLCYLTATGVAPVAKPSTAFLPAACFPLII